MYYCNTIPQNMPTHMSNYIEKAFELSVGKIENPEEMQQQQQQQQQQQVQQQQQQTTIIDDIFDEKLITKFWKIYHVDTKYGRRRKMV